MIRTFTVTVQGVRYEVKVEQITPAAIAARDIIPPPPPKRGGKAEDLLAPLFTSRT